MSQTTFAEIESNRPEPTTDVPRQLVDPSTVREGDLIALDREHMNTDLAYTVTEARSNSLDIERDGNQITLRKRRGEFYHEGSSFTHDVFLIANGEHKLLKCSKCGIAHDPADFVRRVNNRFICGGCD